MEVTHYIEEVEKYLSSFKNQVEDEKKEITDCQKKFSLLLNSFSQKAPSNSVINSLFKDEEPKGFAFSEYEDKKKALAEQRRAEYNAYLEKKEAERLSRKKVNEDKISTSPKSILDSVDYELVLAKRKEEEAKFRSMNLVDVPHSSRPVLKENVSKPNLNLSNGFEHVPALPGTNGVNFNNSAFNLPRAVTTPKEMHPHIPAVENERNLGRVSSSQQLEERIAKHLEEQRRQMLLEFENELRKNTKVKEGIRNLKPPNSISNSPERVVTRLEEFPKLGRTGGGGEPVRDSYGNLITMRGLRKENGYDTGNLTSMQQQSMKDKMSLYREELQKQIEEKRRLEALEKAKVQEQEEKIAQRIEEQRLQMQKEYESELQKTNKMKEEFQRQQERIRKLEEFQRKDSEARRKKPAEAKPPELEDSQKTEVVTERSNSPPIPAVRTKVLFEKAELRPVTEDKPENVFSNLAEIRKKIMEDQQKPKKIDKKSYEVMNRRTVQEISDDEEEDDILKTSYPF